MHLKKWRGGIARIYYCQKRVSKQPLQLMTMWTVKNDGEVFNYATKKIVG